MFEAIVGMHGILETPLDVACLHPRVSAGAPGHSSRDDAAGAAARSRARGRPDRETYAFINDTAWGGYEEIRADIFDHLLAMVPEFGLRVYQKPAGAGVGRLTSVSAAAA